MNGKRLTPNAQRLRADPTEAEKRMWERVKGRQLGAGFTRQFPIGPYVVDFACRGAKLAVEIDGGQHAESVADAERTRLIGLHGYRVIRSWNNDVLENTDGVVAAIIAELDIARNRT